MGKKLAEKAKHAIKKAWHFIWESDSIWSWIVNIILAFVIIKFLVYPALGFGLGTTHPVVAVVSSSMEHNSVPICTLNIEGKCVEYSKSSYEICGFEIASKGFLSLGQYFQVCGRWYEENTGIKESDFENFRFRNGFNKGDIMVLMKPKNIRVGDIIVFNVQGRPDPIIHRVVGISANGYSTKGDHNEGIWEFEKDIPKESVVGKAVLRIPYLGWIKIGFMNIIGR